jgi:hypothetical protein
MFCLILCDIWQGKTSERVPERGEGSRREKEERRSPTVSDLTGDACRWAELRREISQRPVDVFEGDQREMREDVWGY